MHTTSAIQDSATPRPAGPATKVRFGVLGFACVLSMVTYLDRVCFGTVLPFIQKEFDLTDLQRSYLLGAFTIAYAGFEVPSGWLGDLFGPKKALIRVVLWWSVFTALTGLIYPNTQLVFGYSVAFLLLLSVRFFFGMGEAGAYPNIARAFHNWFPVTERGSAKGAVWMAGRFAGGITPFIVLALLTGDERTGIQWRHTFWIFGGLGVIWSVFFWIWFRDLPEQKASVNAAELALIRGLEPTHAPVSLKVPWKRLMTSANLWLICLMYFCASFGWYFNITYLPGFLEEQFGLRAGDKWSPQWWSFSLMAGLPLLFGSVACLFGGLLTDAFIKRTGDRKWGRRLPGLIGHGICAICYFAGVAVIWMHPNVADRGIGTAWLFVLAIAASAFWNDMTMGAAWASCLDIGGRFSGIVAGCMNTIGNLGGFVANILTGVILQHYIPAAVPKFVQIDGARVINPDYFAASQFPWIVNLSLSGIVYVLAILLWIRFDASKPLDRE